jgi:hypothetical protein
MMPSPSRLASWNIRLGIGKAAPWFSLRQIRYSAASTRANQTPNEVVGAPGIITLPEESLPEDGVRVMTAM